MSATTPNLEETLEIISRGAEKIINLAELRKKLNKKRPLRVKFGVDPTAPDIHLGHTVVLQKLRDFQDLGHECILIIGDFTAMIGDPSGRSDTRPQLTHDQVLQNARSYQEQALKVLDREKTRIVFNGEWFEIMHLEEIIHLTSMVTLQQMMQREDFRDRYSKNQPIRAHEILYPIMQGWDSVKIKADIELGGSDQLFNIMVGRDLQRERRQEQQVGIIMQILEGLDGVRKMSKSLNNYVGITEPPGEMFGKLMSISDELMRRYYTLLLMEDCPDDAHPMEAKKELSRRVTAIYHGDQEAKKVLDDWNTRFSQGNLDEAELPTLPTDAVQTRGDIVSMVVTAYQDAFNQKRSKGDARRLVQQGSIQINGEKVTDVTATPDLKAGDIIKLDKKRALRLS
jgi:tyrosyl-tRNA synthetase